MGLLGDDVISDSLPHFSHAKDQITQLSFFFFYVIYYGMYLKRSEIQANSALQTNANINIDNTI